MSTKTLFPVSRDGDKEEYVLPTLDGQSERFTEYLTYQWIATAGSFVDDRRTLYDPKVKSFTEHHRGVPEARLDPSEERLLAIEDALCKLAAFNPRLAQLVECRYFAGMTEEETAEAMASSLRTVQRDWMRARAWLLKAMDPP